jgi:hypothetical protein
MSACVESFMLRVSLVPIAAACLLVCSLSATGCKKKVTQAQCEELLDRYATLVVHEKMKDATARRLEPTTTSRTARPSSRPRTTPAR